MKVVVCDDEFAARILTKSYLTMMGLEVFEATGGKDALDAVNRENPALLVIDYSMPDITGLEVIKRLKGSPPAIIITSEGFTEETEAELKKYAAEYMIKPVMYDSLKDSVYRILGADFGQA